MLLAVPIKLDALLLNKDTPVVGPLVDFGRMPFVEDGADINPDVPFLSSELSNEPFSDEELLLGQGCHLHWALPAVLTRTTHLTSDQKAALPDVNGDEPQFPPVFDRWLVRRTRNGQVDALWLVESNYYSSVPDGRIVHPVRTDRQHGMKAVFQGRTTRLDMGNPQTPKLAAEEQAGYLDYITAIGHGDPTFHAFYPNCRSVFGLFDPEVTDDDRGNLGYDIVGWYSQAELDHFAGTIKDLGSSAKLPGTNISRLDQLRAASDNPSLSDAQLIVAEIEQRFGWNLSVLGKNPTALPKRFVCYASIELTGISNAASKNNTREPTVAIASTGTEALSTLLSRTVFETDSVHAKKLEEQLEALHMTAVLRTQRLDLGPKFKEARQARSFTAVRGDTKWGLRALVKHSGKEVQAFSENIPDVLANLLNELNGFQAALEESTAKLENARAQLYSDWYKYMSAVYPVPGVKAVYPEIDDIVNYINDVGLSEIAALVQAQKKVTGRLERKKNDITTLLHKDPAAFELVQRPGPRYWRPNEPVVMLSGHANATDRHGGTASTPCSALKITHSELSAWLWADPLGALDTIREHVTPDTRSNGHTVSDGRTEHPFLLEWEAEIFPVKRGSNLDSGDRKYAKDYLRKNFSFGPDGMELISTQQLIKGASLYNGRSILTPNASVKLRREMEAFFHERVPKNKLKAYIQAHNAPADRALREAWLANRWSDFADWYLTDESALAKSMGPAYFQHCLDALDRVTSLYNNGTQRLRLDQVRKIATGAVLSEFYRDSQVTDGDPNKLPDEQGSVFVQWYRRQLHLIEFLALYRDHVSDMDRVLSQSLSGFNDALMMHRQFYNLPIADPMGFADYQSFTTHVAATVGSNHYNMPQPLNDFLPLRAGLLKVHALRLVDTFGRVVMDVPESDLFYPAHWLDTDGHCHLPPRLVQPAQLELRWLSAEHDDDRHSNDHPATGPICGWLVANELDATIAVYAPDGSALGSIDDSQNHWSPRPGGGAATPKQIANPFLKAVVNKILETVKSGSIDDLLTNMNDAVQSIDPENFEHHQATALLMSRPLAVVRAATRLRTKGTLAVNQSWEDLQTDMATGSLINDRNHAGLEQLEVNIKLGDHAQLNDGVVGFWPEPAQSVKGKIALGSYQHCSDRERPEITVTLNRDTPERFVILMDPRAKLHATTGILPVKMIDIPAVHFAAALQRIEITFLTTPIITGKELIDLPLMALEGKAWSWLEKQGSVWSETATEGVLRKQVLLDNPDLKGNGAAIWDALAAKTCGWLRPDTSDPLRATVTALDKRGTAVPAIDKDLIPVVERILARTHIVPPETQAAFQQENMIREGWLKLRNAPIVHTPEKTKK